MKVLVALGGNAIFKQGENGSEAVQASKVVTACDQLVGMIRAGHQIAVTHGNGPQVGDIMLANEMAKSVLSPLPLDVCGAESQGMIGYMLQRTLASELAAGGIKREVVTMVTQTVVRESNQGFAEPSKPIGPFYKEAQAKKVTLEKGWKMVRDQKRGYRRVVPSPDPVEIVEWPVFNLLFRRGTIIIASGGGGVPVVRDGSGRLRGVEAVIDKDLSAALLASLLHVDVLLILTDVDGVYLDYGKPGQRLLRKMTQDACRGYVNRGLFPAGSMGPKVEAALRFARSGGRTIITSLEKAVQALEGRAGTEVA